MRDLVIVGAGAHARDVLQIVADLNAVTPSWRVLGLLSDAAAEHATTVAGVPVLGGTDWLNGRSGLCGVLAVGNPAARRQLATRIGGRIGEWPTLIHPTAFIGGRTTVGRGSLVLPGAILMTDVTVGAFVSINIGCHVSHDARVEDFATIAPGANLSGSVRVGEGSDIGTGAAIIQGISIGAWSVVGAGAVVVRDLPGDCTAAGVPARIISQREPGWHETP